MIEKMKKIAMKRFKKIIENNKKRKKRKLSQK